MKNFFVVSIFAALFAQGAHAIDVRVLARAEHVGTDIIYHYTLVNSGDGTVTEFTIGTKSAGNDHRTDSVAPGVYGVAAPEFNETLTRWPTGLAFVPDQAPSYPDAPPLPVLAPGSIGAPAMPAGWKGKISAHPDWPMHSISWAVYERGDTIRATHPAAVGPGQALSGFSVRVPAAKPVLTAQQRFYMASACKYGDLTCDGQFFSLTTGHVTGNFLVEVWRPDLSPLRLHRHMFGAIEKQDTLPPVLSVTLTPSTLKPNEKLVAIAATITVKDDYDPLPAIVLESITANELLEKEDIRDAKIGTDDRQFKLKAEREGKNKAGRIYTVTYSATDGTGNKATASATVTVPHDGRKKDD